MLRSVLARYATFYRSQNQSPKSERKLPMNSQCVAFYLRSATGNEADLSKQKQSLETELRRRGIANEPVLVYADRCSSGMRLGSELLRLKLDVLEGGVHTVIVTEMNRISRDSENLHRFLDFLDGQYVRFLCGKIIDSRSWRERPAPLKRIALYCRVAGRVVANSDSILQQLNQLGSAVLMGNPYGIRGRLEEIYRECGSGHDPARPLFQKLKADIAAGKLDVLLVTDLSRLSRSPSDLAKLLELARKNRCRVISLFERFDSNAAERPIPLIADQGLGGSHV